MFLIIEGGTAINDSQFNWLWFVCIYKFGNKILPEKIIILSRLLVVVAPSCLSLSVCYFEINLIRTFVLLKYFYWWISVFVDCRQIGGLWILKIRGLSFPTVQINGKYNIFCQEFDFVVWVNKKKIHDDWYPKIITTFVVSGHIFPTCTQSKRHSAFPWGKFFLLKMSKCALNL